MFDFFQLVKASMYLRYIRMLFYIFVEILAQNNLLNSIHFVCIFGQHKSILLSALKKIEEKVQEFANKNNEP